MKTDRYRLRQKLLAFAKANGLKAAAFWRYFNLVRPNCGKEWQSPLQILLAQAPALAGALLNRRPLNLSQPRHLYLPNPYNRGHDLPSFPKVRKKQNSERTSSRGG